jgi:hypothetical protein
VQDLGGWPDDHAKKDLEDSQRGSGQDWTVFRCPFDQDLVGRRPQWETNEAARGSDSTGPYHNT